MTPLPHPLLSANESDSNPPADPADLHRLEQDRGLTLPEDYRRFLLTTDGYEGSVGRGDADVYLWAVGEVLSGGYEGPEEIGVTLIGSNGGSTGFGLTAGDPARFVSIPLASSDPREIRVLGHTFEEFLQSIARGQGW